MALLFIKARVIKTFSASFLSLHFYSSTHKCLKEPGADAQELQGRGSTTVSGQPWRRRIDVCASWLPIMRNGSVAEVMCACSPASDAARNSGQACRSCSGVRGVRPPLPWLPRWMLQKRPSEAKNHRGMRNRELLGGWGGCRRARSQSRASMQRCIMQVPELLYF